MRRCRAGANEIGQPIISIADKRVIGRCVPILGSWVVGDDPAAAGIQAFGHNTEAGAQIIRVQGPVAKDTLKFRNEISSIEFRHQSYDSPKRAAEYPGTECKIKLAHVGGPIAKCKSTRNDGASRRSSDE